MPPRGTKIAPGEFVREAAMRVARRGKRTVRRPVTPELIELLKRTFRGVHVLAYLKRQELAHTVEQDRFERAATAAKAAQSEIFTPSDST